MSTLLLDLRMALRRLRKRPGFTAVVAVTLALGIGANAAIYSVVERVILHPLPYHDLDRLLALGWSWNGGAEMQTQSLTPLEYQFWKQNSRSFSDVAATDPAHYNLTGEGQPRQLQGLTVSANYFRAVGVPPTLGRGFLAEEDVPNGPRVAILSNRLWRGRFAADSLVVGRTVSLNGEPYAVVGVMPAAYDAMGFDVLAPLQLKVDPGDGGHNYDVLGRLASGVTVPQAEREMVALTQRFHAAYPDAAGPRERLVLATSRQVASGEAATAVWVLFGAVGLLLLIACVNVANLLLGRVAERQGEMAIRAALGAGRGDLVRQLLLESVVLSLLGGALGLLVAAWGLKVLLVAAPVGMAGVGDVHLSGSVLAFTFALSLVTGVMVGGLGALRGTRTEMISVLREGGRGRTSGRSRQRLRHLLVGMEAMLSMVLLVGAGLLIASFMRLRGVEMGFQPEHLLTAELNLPPERYASTMQTWQFESAVLDRLRATSGVTAVGAASSLPLERGLNLPLTLEAPGPRRTGLQIEYRAVSPSYLQALGATLLKGRGLMKEDDATGQPVALVNEAFARDYLTEQQEPLGASIVPFGMESERRTVVGVVQDIRDIELNAAARPTVFVPSTQVSDTLTTMMNGWFAVAFVVRTTRPELAAASFRQAVQAVDPMQPILRIRSMDEVIGGSISAQRFDMLLLGTFAALALLLTAVGIYGVVSYTVQQRAHEIGIRMALGARESGVMAMVLWQGLGVVVVGLAAGLALALIATRALASLLYGVSPSDPATFAAVAVVLLAVAALACWLPARRATRVDPMVALRAE